MTLQSAAAFLLLLLVGCTGAPQSLRLETHPPAGLPLTTELKQTPFFPQEKYQCGPAALATVLVASGVQTSPIQLRPQVYLPGRKGSLQIEMIAAARRQDRLVYPLRGRLADLLTEVAAEHPVLVLQNLAFDWLPRWHYAVVVGYDLAARQLILRSGTSRRWQTTFSTFERTWKRSGYWGLVILPPGEVPATAEPPRYLMAAHGLEQVGRLDAARAAYTAATRRWPEVARAWLMLGNLTLAVGAPREAGHALRRATELEPENPVGWNNLAYALLAVHCPRQALRAIRCAARLAPEDANIRDSLAEIRDRASGPGGASCRPIQCGPPSPE